jgi:hypothetical protein
VKRLRRFGVQEVPGSNPGSPTRFLKYLQPGTAERYQFWSPTGTHSRTPHNWARTTSGWAGCPSRNRPRKFLGLSPPLNRSCSHFDFTARSSSSRRAATLRLFEPRTDHKRLLTTPFSSTKSFVQKERWSPCRNEGVRLHLRCPASVGRSSEAASSAQALAANARCESITEFCLL